MNSVIHAHLDDLIRLCRKYKVRRLELFGSASRDDFDPERSDLDFLVEFLPLDSGEHFDTYFGLLEELEKLFGRHIDLVVDRAIRNMYFREAVDRSRITLYAA